MSVGWSGVVDGAVGESQGEFAVGSEFDGPAVVVDLGVVSGADGDQIVEIGAAAVSPPDDVMQFAVVVADGAAGDRAATVETA